MSNRSRKQKNTKQKFWCGSNLYINTYKKIEKSEGDLYPAASQKRLFRMMIIYKGGLKWQRCTYYAFVGFHVS